MLQKYFYSLEDIVPFINKYDEPTHTYEQCKTMYIEVPRAGRLSKYKLLAFQNTLDELKLIDEDTSNRITNRLKSISYFNLSDLVLKNMNTHISYEEIQDMINNNFINERKLYMHTLIQYYIDIMMKYFNIEYCNYKDIKDIKLYYMFNDTNSGGTLYMYRNSFIDDMNYWPKFINEYRNKSKEDYLSPPLFVLEEFFIPTLPDVFKLLFLYTSFLYIKDKKDNEYLITNLFDDDKDINIKDSIKDEEITIESMNTIMRNKLIEYNYHSKNILPYHFCDSLLGYSYKDSKYSFYKGKYYGNVAY